MRGRGVRRKGIGSGGKDGVREERRGRVGSDMEGRDNEW